MQEEDQNQQPRPAMITSPEWCVLDEFEFDFVEANSQHFRFQPGEAVFHEGDIVKGTYFLESGMVAVRKSDPKGQATLLKLAQPGDTLGYRPLIANECHRASAEAMEESDVYLINKSAVRELVASNPALGLSFLKRAAKELGIAEEKFHESVTLSMRARFAHLLLSLKEKWGQQQEDGTLHLALPVSRSDLAEMLGVRRESLSRLIHDLQTSDVAHFYHRMVIIPKPDDLLAIFRRD